MATPSTDLPVPPFRTAFLRHDRGSGKFTPCSEGDRRCTLSTPVDGLGRPVIRQGHVPLGLGRTVGGYRLAYPTSSGPDPAEVVAFFDREASRRRKARA